MQFPGAQEYTGSARQSEKVGQPHGGIKIYDVTEANDPQLLSYLDLTGPNSRGTHYLTFTDGKFAYLSTGAKDFVPKNPLDDQMLMIIDLQDPKSPKELGRWWLPGTEPLRRSHHPGGCGHPGLGDLPDAHRA
jgi:hypothetical protein